MLAASIPGVPTHRLYPALIGGRGEAGGGVGEKLRGEAEEDAGTEAGKEAGRQDEGG